MRKLPVCDLVIAARNNRGLKAHRSAHPKELGKLGNGKVFSLP
jgi:hypothetical protein